MSLYALLQAVIDPANAKPVIDVLVGLGLAGTAYFNKRSETKTRAVVTEAITAHSRATNKRFDVLDKSLTDLRGIVVGPDGKNGMRARQEEIREDVKEMREILSTESIAAGRVDERVKAVEKKVDGLEERERDG